MVNWLWDGGLGEEGDMCAVGIYGFISDRVFI